MAKFRSWNKELKCFIRFKNGRYYIENIKGFKGYKGNGSYSYYFNWQNAEQSTGRKDNNGIEIFVGDILKYENSTIYGVKLNPVRSEIALFFNNKIYAFPFGDLRHNLEIVGSIHENKELLNEV